MNGGGGILGVKREPTPTPEPRTANPAYSKKPEQEALLIMAFYFEEQNRWARSRKPPRGPEDISAESFKKAHAIVAAFKRGQASRKIRRKSSDAEPGLPRNPSFGYASFGGPYLKRP